MMGSNSDGGCEIMGTKADSDRLWDAIDELRKDSKESLIQNGKILSVLSGHTEQLSQLGTTTKSCDIRLSKLEDTTVTAAQCAAKHDAKFKISGSIFAGAATLIALASLAVSIIVNF